MRLATAGVTGRPGRRTSPASTCRSRWTPSARPPTRPGWPSDCVVDNDLFALLRAGTDEPDAVAVVCGAGHQLRRPRAPTGAVARFPALGTISGDWGGGGHLAALALWHAARGEDGRGPATALTDAVTDHFRPATVEEIACALHLGEIAWSRLDELAPILFDGRRRR